MRVIEDQIALLASRNAIAPDAPFIGAGVGRAVAERLAQRQGRSYRDFAALIVAASDELRVAAANCAPATALALLAL
jgi:hypothetical protein